MWNTPVLFGEAMVSRGGGAHWGNYRKRAPENPRPPAGSHSQGPSGRQHTPCPAAVLPDKIADAEPFLHAFRVEPHRHKAAARAGTPMDTLTMALCISIGTGMPWLLATYSEDRARQLIENSVFALAGTALAAGAFNGLLGAHGIIALVSLGPVVAYLTIVGGQGLKSAILSRLSRP